MHRNGPLLSLLVMATAASSPAQGRDVRDEDEASRVFAAVVAQQAKVSGFSGSALVARGSKTLYRGSAGSANMESRAPNRPSTKYRIGSLTKQFTAALVMQLVDAGELDLDAAVTRYLEDYRADTGDRITLRHLLTHSSGLPNYTDDPDLRVSMRQATTVVAFVASACSGDLEFEPGTAVKYCNSGYFLLGAILEEVTGQRYDTLLRARILDPLDLTGTGYDRHRAVIVGRARGHERIGGVLVPSACGSAMGWNADGDGNDADGVWVRPSTASKSAFVTTPWKSFCISEPATSPSPNWQPSMRTSLPSLS